MMTPWGYVLTAEDAAMTPARRYAMAQVLKRRARTGLSGNDLSKAMKVAAALTPPITFRSQLTPDFTYDAREPTTAEPGGPGLFMRLLKPSMIVHLPTGPVEHAPYGKPEVDLFPLATVLALGGAAFLGYQVAKGLGLAGR